MTSSKKFIPEFKIAWQLLNEEALKMRVQKHKDNTFSNTENEICETCNQNHRHIQNFDDVKTSIDHLVDLLNKRREKYC